MKSKADAYFTLFTQQLACNDRENALGLLRSLCANFEVSRFALLPYQAEYVETLNMFLQEERFYQEDFFQKHPFRAAGDVMHYMAMLYMNGGDPPAGRDMPACDALCIAYSKMLHTLEQRTAHISEESVCRLRLARQGVRLSKEQDHIFRYASREEIEDLFAILAIDQPTEQWLTDIAHLPSGCLTVNTLWPHRLVGFFVLRKISACADGS